MITFDLPWSVIWLAIVFVALAVELVTVRRVAFWCLPAGLVAEVLSLFFVPFWVQIPVFLVLTAAGLFLLRPRILLGKAKSTTFSLDELIGAEGIVTARIESIAGNGEVEVDGRYWAARAVEEGRIYEEGEHVTVVAVEGVKLICK